ncbi:hypothetical protein F5I97DRAFT_1799891, partial [Phlebopus sp. FC_14]
QYKKYMTVYLGCLKEIFLELKWHPNHHAALHINEFPLQYGLMHRWWMFSFKRIIGVLQKTNTNHKINKSSTMEDKVY